MIEIILGTTLLVGLTLSLAGVVALSRRALTHTGPVVVTVNEREEIHHAGGGTLLDALTEGGITVPSACAGAGTCGLCRVTVTGGGGAPLPVEIGRLTAAERRGGVRLACQVKLRGDMGVTLPEELIGATPVTCRLTAARFLTPLIREIVLQFPEGAHPDIVAGSFLQITAPPYRARLGEVAVPEAYADVWTPLADLEAGTDEPVTRAYSISNRPEDTADGRAVLNIRLALPPPDRPEVPPGIVSSWLFAAAEGTEVAVSGPFGSFRAQDTEAEMVLIGGGVGMAPLRAIILDQLARGTGRKIGFWYGARSRREIFYAEEFAALAAAHPNFTCTVALSDPAEVDDWDGTVGFIHQVVQRDYLAAHPAPEACEYYLCGPPLMIRAVMAMLDEAGVERDHVFNDDFGV